LKIKIFIDCQDDLFNGSMKCEGSDNNLAVKIGESFQQSIRNKDKIIFTLETHHQSKTNHNIEQYVFPEHCMNLSEGWLMIPHLQHTFDEIGEEEMANIIAIEKNTFGSIELIAIIRGLIKDSKYVEIELCGLPTDISVLHNAIILYNTIPTAKFSIDSACCAGTTIENHNITLKILNDLGFKIK